MNYFKIQDSGVNLDNVVRFSRYDAQEVSHPTKQRFGHRIVFLYSGFEDDADVFEFINRAERDAEYLRLKKAVGLGGNHDDRP